jgi:nicotinamidase-related amidase
MTELSPSARQVPPPPDPVAVTLDSATTALLVMDITEATCGPQPNCREMLPRLAALVARARSAGLPIVYTSGATSSPVLPDVAPGPDDPVIQGSQNKFFNTRLDDILSPRGVRTLVLSGWRTNGSVTYTSHGATNLGYTVVVPVDGTAAAESFQVAIGLYQVLNLLSGNASNEPLKTGAVTLSRTDLITFR